jgi:hypothetical protein
MRQENASNKPLIRYVNRQQMSWRAVDVERLIGEDHPARAIWTLVGRLDLSPFYRSIESSAEEGGRPAFDPQLLISLWVYAYSLGIGSAREVARRCDKSCIRRDDAKCGQGYSNTATKPKQKIAKPARANRSVVRT